MTLPKAGRTNEKAAPWGGLFIGALCQAQKLWRTPKAKEVESVPADAVTPPR